MNKKQRRRIKRLTRLIMKIWREAEQAEARIITFDRFARQLAAVGILPERTVIGKLILVRDYSPNGEECETVQVFQAALLIPDGIGALVWDSAEYLDLDSDDQLSIEEARWRFVPFASCPPIGKASLARQAEALFSEILEHLNVRRRWLEPFM